MARDRSKYLKPKKTLKEQAYEELASMMALGESKRQAKDTDAMKDKIFSKATYQTYRKHIYYFCDWVKEHYPNCKSIKKARRYVNEWLEYRTNECKNQSGEPLSAWTIQTEAAALNKLYQIDVSDPERFQPPKRKRKDIKRSRGAKVRDKHFSKITNEELINFCKGCGLRRNVMEKITANDLYTKADLEQILTDSDDEKLKGIVRDALSNFGDMEYFVYSYRDKGGKSRFSPIVGEHTEEIVARFRATAPGKKVWEYVNQYCDVHGYRSDYAVSLYKRYARDIKDIPYDRVHPGTGRKYRSAKEVYICRGSEAGKVLDRKAILKISKALGHNREDTAITNYLRNL